MRQLLKILLVLISMIMMACHSEESELGISWSQESARVLQSGIKNDYESKIIVLDFYTDNQVDVSVSSNETWIKPSVTINNRNGKLTIEIMENPGISSREGEVTLVVQGKTVIVNISQTGSPKVFADKDSYYLKSDKGNVVVHVKANGKLSAEIYPANCEWARVIKTTSCGDNEYVVNIGVDKNEGLGRIASLNFKIDGKTAIQDCGPCLIQEPTTFAEKTTIVTKKPGCLQVLMGNDIENLRHIRSLKLVGVINGLDFIMLKKLFLDKEESVEQYPINIDLSECSIIAGNKNPFEYFGWLPSTTFEEIFMYDEIPTGIFNNAVNLKQIVLPNNLKIVGRSAFRGCRNLKAINIPDYVEEINSKAFYNCVGLKEINLTSNSCLSSIGNQAFNTKSVLKDLTIPATVINVETEAFLGCSVSKLHLKWQEPLEVRIVPKTEGCTLCVPKGTAAIYRSTLNWLKFQNIIEE